MNTGNYQKNSNLHKVKNEKKDEFYTQITDIEKELRHYKNHFAGKTVFCNCDDPNWDNFWRFFSLNFDQYGLEKLISTHVPTYKMERTGMSREDFKVTPLYCNGDFRSNEAIEILMESDIVVSNPPFSLFLEYIAQLIEYKKYFFVIGNMNAITYKEIFPLIKDNKLWLVPSLSNGDKKFRVPDSYPVYAAGSRLDENGNKSIRVKGVQWFTNIDHSKRN